MWCVIYAERRRSGSSLPNLYYPVAGPAAFRDLAYLRRESGSPKPRNYDLIANLANTEPAAVAVAFSKNPQKLKQLQRCRRACGRF